MNSDRTACGTILHPPQSGATCCGRLAEGAGLRSLGLRVAVLAAALVLGRAHAAAAATPWSGDAHAAVRLITAVTATGSASTVEAGLEIRLMPGWHVYWRSPGDAGIPPSIEWAGSTNLAHAQIAWPAPTRFSVQGLETAGYDVEDARDYTVAACWEFIVPGKGMEVVNIGAVSMPAAADQAIRAGLNAGEGFDRILDRVGENIAEQVHALAETSRRLLLPPAPWYSVLMDGCLERGP